MRDQKLTLPAVPTQPSVGSRVRTVRVFEPKQQQLSMIELRLLHIILT